MIYLRSVLRVKNIPRPRIVIIIYLSHFHHARLVAEEVPIKGMVLHLLPQTFSLLLFDEEQAVIHEALGPQEFAIFIDYFHYLNRLSLVYIHNLFLHFGLIHFHEVHIF